VSIMKIIPINFSDRHWTSNRFILCFGAYGDTRLMVWANHLEDALDECVDWISENAPGLLCNEQVNEAYREWLDENAEDPSDPSEDEQNSAYEYSLEDVTTAGNAGDHILSYEWGIVAENPTREQIKELRHL
jgi:hypothetical protein